MKLFTTMNYLALLLALAGGSRAGAVAATNGAAPVTARDFYNTGARLLAAGKLAEAEQMFYSSLTTQDERVRPPALFNLAHTRFATGVEILKQGPEARKVTAQGNAALAAGEQVIRSTESALAENELTKMISAYLAGRGARRELRAAEKAVQAALETYGKTLTKWRRAADDFRGAAELNPTDTNAASNASIVEQNISRLVDSLRQMQQMAGKIGGQKEQLAKALGQLKGRIPAPNAPPGGPGDEEADEDGGRKPEPESLAGKTEDPSREGEPMQIPLSPDQAGQMLDGISLDGTRRLPMSDQEGTKPKSKTGRNW